MEEGAAVLLIDAGIAGGLSPLVAAASFVAVRTRA
jgi:hypothetical protein